MWAAVIAVLAAGLATLAEATASQNLAVKCAGQPGFAANEYIVGENAFRNLTQHGVQVTAIKGWNESEPIHVIDGCPVKYYLVWDDEVHVIFTKTDSHESIALEWHQEPQILNQVNKDIKFLFAWEKHYQMAGGYKEQGGMSSHPYFNDRMLPDANGYYWGFFSSSPPLYWDAWPVSNAPSWLGFSGLHEIQADSAVDELTEQRHDFYHQGSNRKPNGFYEYQSEQHFGEENGKLRVVLYAKDSNQVVTGLTQETTFFRGTFTLSSKDETGTMLQAEYNALKQFYLDACATRRDGADPYGTWGNSADPSHWTRDKWFETEGRDYTEIPYCTWLQFEGWNSTYWDAHLNTPGGTCHFIDAVTCDGDGHIISLFLPEMGLKGDATSLLAAMTHLEEFNAIFNMLEGQLPASNTGFIAHNKLRSFSLWHNDMTGSLPCFGDQVYSIDLSFNRFSGKLPTCAGGVAPNASIWWLENNYITGTVPSSFGGLENLRVLAIMYNQLTGQLPTALCNLDSIVEMNFEGNKIHGSIPTGCLDSGAEDKGWVKLRYLIMDHNRLSGSVPILDRHRGITSECGGTGCHMGSFWYQHNLFTGQLGTRLDDALAYAQENNLNLLFDFKGNRLWGTLPPRVEDWSFRVKGKVNYDFTDNYFRCAPDGRWPDWAERKVGSYQRLGKCLPVAHPRTVSPTTWTLGQAGMLAVWGDDFVQRGDHSCQFKPTGSGTAKLALATRESDNLIRCLVPVDLQVGTYEVTISNFGDDFADQTKLSILGALPTVQIQAPVEPDTADAVSAEMSLGGIDSSGFDSAAFAAAIAALLGVNADDVTILGADRRRLTSSSNLRVRFVVKTENAEMGYNDIVDALNNEQEVKQQLSNRGLSVTTVSTETSAARTAVETQTTTDNEGIPIVWIIVAAAAVVVACGLCCFIGFLYRMEKKGQAYFKETLDDDAGPSSGTTIGKAAEPNEV